MMSNGRGVWTTTACQHQRMNSRRNAVGPTDGTHATRCRTKITTRLLPIQGKPVSFPRLDLIADGNQFYSSYATGKPFPGEPPRSSTAASGESSPNNRATRVISRRPTTQFRIAITELPRRCQHLADLEPRATATELAHRGWNSRNTVQNRDYSLRLPLVQGTLVSLAQPQQMADRNRFYSSCTMGKPFPGEPPPSSTAASGDSSIINRATGLQGVTSRRQAMQVGIA